MIYTCYGGPMDGQTERSLKLRTGDVVNFKGDHCQEQYEFRSGKLHYIGQANFTCQLCNRPAGIVPFRGSLPTLTVSLAPRPPYERVCQWCRGVLNRN